MNQDRQSVLLVDDEEQMLLAMETVLAREGFSVLKSSNGQDALELLGKSKVDLVISDMRMPVMGGSELLEKVSELYPRVPMVMITAYGTIEQAVTAMREGAADFITKPFSAEDLQAVVSKLLQSNRKPAPRKSASGEKSGSAIITIDPKFKQIIEIAATIAQSTASVLIQGESGTGKELIARLIHTASRRADGPFVAVNCAAVPENLLESELFGHEKGSFTGALTTKIGKFELANGGTILLDEISEMDPLLQAKLLRVLQERELDRVGSNKPIPIDVRVVATTNRDIRESVRKGEFREDLYYRLNVVPLFVPALRERKGDVRILVEHFLRRYSEGGAKELKGEILSKLESYPWPGNVRELQNSCERAVLLSGDGPLQLEHFLINPLPATGAEAGSIEEDLKLVAGLSVAEAERRLIFETLRSTANNKTRAAELLGISIRTLRNKLHEYGANVGDSDD